MNTFLKKERSSFF